MPRYGAYTDWVKAWSKRYINVKMEVWVWLYDRSTAGVFGDLFG
jgi:hypothetical protein